MSKTVPLRRIARINPSTPEFDALAPGHEITFMPLEAVWSDQRLDTSRKVAKATAESGYTRFRSGDAIIPKVSPTFTAARTAVMKIDGVGAGTTELHVLRATEQSDIRFLSYVARSKHFLEEGETAYEGVAGLRRVPADFLAEFRIPALDTHEQCRIADFLDDQVARIDATIAARRAQRQLVEEHRLSALFNDLTDAPTVELRRGVRRLVNGSTPAGADPSNPDARAVPWYTPTSIEDSGELGEPVRWVRRGDPRVVRFPAQSVLVVAIGASTAGRVTWLEDPGAGNQQLTAVQTDDDRLSGRFLMLQLEARRFELFHAAAATAQPLLSNGTLKAFPIAMPPRPIQESLARQWMRERHNVRRIQASASQSISLLSEYKQSLITAAVSGELDVTTSTRTLVKV